MANSFTGFAGSVDHIEDSVRSAYQGSDVAVVRDSASLRVTANTAATRTVNYAGGVCWAHGVRATFDPGSVVFDDVTTVGQTRWDAVIVRRNWAGQTVTIGKVNGVAAVNAPRVLPAGVQNQPGSLHDQVLALVQLTYGSTVPTVVEERRLIAHKVIFAPSVAALPAGPSLYGAEALLPNGNRYRYVFDASNALAWMPSASAYAELLQSAFIATGPGFTAAGLANRALYSTITGDVQLDMQVRRSGVALTPSADGNFTDTLLATVANTNLQPDRTVPFMGQYAAGSGPVYLPFAGVFDTNGLLQLQSGVSNMPLVTRTGENEISLRMHIRFTRKV